MKSYIPQRSGKKWEKFEKKSFGFRKKKFGSDTNTEIGPGFQFPIPKPNLGITLHCTGFRHWHMLKQNFYGELKSWAEEYNSAFSALQGAKQQFSK